MDITFEANGIVERWLGDAQTYQRIKYGSVVEDRPFTADDIVWYDLVVVAAATSSGNFRTKIQNALTSDATYLDKVQAGTALQQDHIQHIAALTRQVQALIVDAVLQSND